MLITMKMAPLLQEEIEQEAALLAESERNLFAKREAEVSEKGTQMNAPIAKEKGEGAMNFHKTYAFQISIICQQGRLLRP